ncbi:hypothetical protein DFH11DRAFT_1711213 [Phellopilus nigrolimitatus]|nr:hypothetical protein DFH11DRAFT_1711213 [Phellopilus nigrolimitatus]
MAYCDRCQRSFLNDSALDQHERDSGNHWICYKCDLDFSTTIWLEQHYVQSPNHSYCRSCMKHFDDDSAYVYHCVDVHYYCSPVCSACTRIFSSSEALTDHNESSHNYCRDCKRFFKTPAGLQTHCASSVHTPRTIACPGRKCHKSFASHSALIMHSESDTCPSGVTRKAVNAFVARIDRQNIITNPARMIAGPAGYTIPVETEYWATAEMYNGRAFECFLCLDTFRTLSALDAHLKSLRHLARIYRCPGAECQREFPALSALWQHVGNGACGIGGNRQVQHVMDTQPQTALESRLALSVPRRQWCARFASYSQQSTRSGKLFRVEKRQEIALATGSKIFHELVQSESDSSRQTASSLMDIKFSPCCTIQTTMAYCDRCRRPFPHPRVLDQHKRDSKNHWIHFYCQICDEHFDSDNTYWNHCTNEHHFCTQHRAIFNTLEGLRQHRIQSGDHYYCILCDYPFVDQDDLLEHGEEWHYVCRTCITIFASASELLSHNDCTHCYCYDCGRRFQTRANLESHRASSTHTPRTIVCPGRNCRKAFVSVSALILHAESGGCPSGITRQAVDAFVARMDRQNVITNPARMIGEPGDYGPPAETRCLVSHATTWNGVAYECFLCRNEFATLRSLDRHLRSPRHRERIYRCPGPGCGLECSALSALCQHVERGGCGIKTNRQVQDIMDRLTSGMMAIAI